MVASNSVHALKRPADYWKSRLKKDSANLTSRMDFRRDGSTKHFDLNFGAWKSKSWEARIKSAHDSLAGYCIGDSGFDSGIGQPPSLNGHTMTSLHFGYIVSFLKNNNAHQRIVEVGGGFGGLAYAAYQVGTEHITMVDFKPMLDLQSSYLIAADVQPGMLRKRYDGGSDVPATGMWREFSEAGQRIPTTTGFYSAFVNMTSMCEMSRDQVAYYIYEAGNVVQRDGLFVSVNHKKCVGCGTDQWDMPMQRWRKIIDKPFPNEPGKRGDIMVWRHL